MTLEEYRRKPVWPDYELLLIDKGWAPCWSDGVEALLAATGIVCPDCGQRPGYVGMHKGGRVLAFVVCREPCSQWLWFKPSLLPGADLGSGGGQA